MKAPGRAGTLIGDAYPDLLSLVYDIDLDLGSGVTKRVRDQFGQDDFNPFQAFLRLTCLKDAADELPNRRDRAWFRQERDLGFHGTPPSRGCSSGGGGQGS